MTIFVICVGSSLLSKATDVTIVNDCFVISVGSSLLSKTVDVTVPNKEPLAILSYLLDVFKIGT